MLLFLFCLFAVFSLLSIGVPLRVSGHPTKDDQQDGLIKDILLPALAISIEVPIPTEWQRSLRFLRRTALPNISNYRQKLLTSERVPIGKISIISPSYGSGTRYEGPRFKLEGEDKPTAISFYFDEYIYGFEFVNNLASTPAVVEELTEEADPSTGVKKTIEKYKFSKEEGIALAKDFIAKYTPGVTSLGQDFSIIETAEFQKEKSRPFIYRLMKAYRGVLLYDEYIQVAIDGEKKLMNLSYFWSPSIEPASDDFTVIDPGFALERVKRLVLEEWNNAPPPLTLFNIQLGFVNHRANTKAIVPVWMFNLRWNELITLENVNPGPREARFGKQVVERELVLAVDALTGSKFEMIPPSLKGVGKAK